MSWVDLEIPSRARVSAPFQASCNAAGKRFTQALIITVRSAESGLSWCGREVRVRVQRGTGEHAGRLRISHDPSGQLAFRSATGRTSTAVRLRIPGFVPLPAAGMPSTALAFDVEDSAFVVRLPSWASNRMPAVTEEQIEAAAAARRAAAASATAKAGPREVRR